MISNDIELDKESIEAIYQNRWKVEVFHNNIKSNTELANHRLKKRKKAQKEAFKAGEQIQALTA